MVTCCYSFVVAGIDYLKVILPLLHTTSLYNQDLTLVSDSLGF